MRRAALPTRARPRAFTVTELVAVLAVIAVVLAIAFPAAQRVMSSARSASCLANHRQLSMALSDYATANAGKLPCPRTDGSDGDGSIRARVEGQDLRPSGARPSQGDHSSFTQASMISLSLPVARQMRESAAP